VFEDGAGGWYHAVNHELDGSAGGVSVLRFAADGSVLDAYSVLDNTRRNCAGGPTPWGTWLSCEEVDDGIVYECDPTQSGQGVALPALGTFNHEAVAVDPERGQLYLTEDKSDGLLYRFTPAAYPNLDSGVLEAARFVDGIAEWIPVPDPTAASRPVREQFEGQATTFNGGEGIWYHNDRVYFTTKRDHRVWQLSLGDGRLDVVWAGNPGDPTRDQLTAVDNITVENGTGDLYVAEDGGNMELVVITPEGDVAPFVRVSGQNRSEMTGPCFNPAGDRLYFSSQRGIDGNGITYVVTGPFRGIGSSVTAESSSGAAEGESPDDAVSTDDAELTTEDSPTEEPTAEPSNAAAPDESTALETAEPTEDETGPEIEAETEPEQQPADEVADQPAAATAVPLTPETPDPGSTLEVASQPVDDGSSALAIAAVGTAAVAGLAGAALIALRRRQDDVLAD
jgi:secreted PhoX family phosphatase